LYISAVDAVFAKGGSSVCQVLALSSTGTNTLPWVQQCCWWLSWWNQLLHQRHPRYIVVMASCRRTSGI